MSFRSVGALPIRLRGRLATRRAINFDDSAINRRCAHSLAQAVGTVSGGDIVQQQRKPSELVPAQHDDLGSRSEQGRVDASRSNDEELHHQARSSDTLLPTKTDLNPSVFSRRKGRIGAELEVPDFIKDYHASSTSPAIQSDNGPQRSHLTDLEEERYRYEEWEQLHDKFFTTLKSAPDILSQTFLEQRRLAGEFLSDITRDEHPTDKFRRKWHALDVTRKNKLVPALLLGSLVESARQTLFVLSNIRSIPYSFRIRMNCLRHLVRIYWEDLQQNSRLKALFEEVVEGLRSPYSWPNYAFPTVLLKKLLSWSTPEQCQKIIKDFSEKYPDPETSSVIAIVDHYLRIEDREQAFEYFKRLPTDALRQPTGLIKSLRDELLKLDFVERSEHGANFKYLPKLLALGMQPDEDLHNIVIENAISNEMPDVAWDLHQYMESSKFRSSARSHLVLLRDSFTRGNFKRVNEVMTSIHNREDLVRDQYIMAYSMNIIRNICCYEKKLTPNEARSHVMALYDRAYDRAPLIRLGIVASLEESPPGLSEPSPTLLAFTIWTCILIRRKEYDVRTLWEWFVYLIANGDEAVCRAARHGVIYEGFILFYVRRLTSLFRSFDVIQYMLSSQLCPPTPRAWSILLCGFLKHGHIEEAERVLMLMRSKGYRVEDAQEATEKYARGEAQEYDLEAMAARIDSSLDERVMPEGIDELLADSLSIRREKQVPAAIAGFSDGPI